MDGEKTVVIGAGIAGLTVAALLAQAGQDVTVLEAHVDPGGSAATFYYKQYRFDAGATLVGGFQPGGPHERVGNRLRLTWPVRPVDPGICFHSPLGTVARWGDGAAWEQERVRRFGEGAERFWQMQEWIADRIWRFAASLPPWPPEGPADLAALAGRLLRQPTLAALAPLSLTSVQRWMAATGAHGPLLQQFVDAQLLISAQSTAAEATALFGAVALDLPRAGVYQVEGGVGTLAETLATQIEALGGRVIYRAEVTRIEPAGNSIWRIHTRKKGSFEADLVVANLLPWTIGRLLGEAVPAGWLAKIERLPRPWGAFTLYLGVDDGTIPEAFPHHHQIVRDPAQPLGEGNSLFLSISAEWDKTRAPAGRRAITMSTHTDPAPWWALRHRPGGREAYEQRVERYTARFLEGAERLLPGLRDGIRLLLPGTPVTFEFFTGRHHGYVGGFPQTSLFATRQPRLPLRNFWMVGDSIFPGQSTAGVTLGALRVADRILREMAPARRTVVVSEKPPGAL